MSHYMLFVDDDPIVLSYLKRRARDEVRWRGYHIHIIAVGTGQLALDVIFRNGTDQLVGVLTDMNMPGMTGTELLSEIFVIDESVPVCVMSGVSGPGVIVLKTDLLGNGLSKNVLSIFFGRLDGKVNSSS